MPKLSEVIGQEPKKPLRLSDVMASQPKAPPANPSLFRMDSDFRERAPGVGAGDMLWGAARDMFGSRAGAAEYLAEQAGGRVVGDENGEPLVELPDGTRYRLNDPGIDSADAANVVGNVAAFWSPASWAARLGQAKNLGLGGRMGLQALTAAGTDAGLQLGTEGKIDPQRTAITAAGAGAGEAVGTALGVVADKVGKLVRTRSGRQAAIELARDAGIPEPAPEVIERMASGLDEIRAGADPRAILGREEFKFTYTQGQRMLDPERRLAQMSREEALRNMPGSQEVFARVSRDNAGRLDDALTNISGRLGGRIGASPSELTDDAARGLRTQADDLGRQVDEAYGEVAKSGRAVVGSDAVRAAPDRISGSLRDFNINPKLHPAAAETLSQLRQAAADLPPGAKGVTLQALETQRRIINANYGAAANSADRAAMAAIKREFDGFMDDAIETALVSGDPAALETLKRARGLRAEFGRRFEGKADSDKFIAGLLDGSKTPEELVNMALGASQVSKAGGARFIERLRVAAQDDPAIMGNLRAAHFMRLTRGRNGEALDPGKIVSNIKTTEYNNASILRALYEKEEWAQIRRLAAALEPMLAPEQLSKTSGSIERLLRFMTQKMMPSLPLVGDTAEAVSGGVNSVRANKIVTQPLRGVPQSLPGSQATGAAVMEESGR